MSANLASKCRPILVLTRRVGRLAEPQAIYNRVMTFDDYKLVIYRNQPDGWVAEIPAIAGCHALMPTAEDVVSELAKVSRLIEEEHSVSGRTLPRDTTEIVHA